jgi:hypothetical protein
VKQGAIHFISANQCPIFITLEDTISHVDNEDQDDDATIHPRSMVCQWCLERPCSMDHELTPTGKLPHSGKFVTTYFKRRKDKGKFIQALCNIKIHLTSYTMLLICLGHLYLYAMLNLLNYMLL